MNNDEDFEIIESFILNGSGCFFVNKIFGTAQSHLINIVEPDPDLLLEEDEEFNLSPVKKIGVCGSFGTGKNEFAAELSNLLDLPLIEDISNTVFSMGFNLNNINSQIMIMMGQLYEQLTNQEFITDGTLIDILAHVYYMREKKDLGLNSYMATAMFNFLNFFMRFEYNAMFYMPIPSIIAKGRPEKQRQIDKIIVSLLELMQVRYIPVVGSSKDRLIAAKKYLTELGMI